MPAPQSAEPRAPFSAGQGTSRQQVCAVDGGTGAAPLVDGGDLVQPLFQDPGLVLLRQEETERDGTAHEKPQASRGGRGAQPAGPWAGPARRAPQMGRARSQDTGERKAVSRKHFPCHNINYMKGDVCHRKASFILLLGKHFKRNVRNPAVASRRPHAHGEVLST